VTGSVTEPGDPRFTVHRVAFTAAALAAVGTLAGSVGDLWWVFGLASALRIQYLLVFTILVGVFVLLRAWALAALCITGLLINLVVIAPLYLSADDESDPGSDSLEVMFLNVGVTGADPDELIETLRAGEHDLVFLAAATDAWTNLLSAAPIPYTVVQARPRGVPLEIIALARQDVQAHTAIHSFGMSGRDLAVEAVIELDGALVRVMATHPVSPITAERARRNTVHIEGLASWAASQDDPVLIVGDLNNTPWSPGFRMLEEDGNLVNSQRGFGVQASWPSWVGLLGIPIDHALHSQELTTIQRTLGSGYGSAHRSLAVTVALSDDD
jgi:endonuclease/exonuclease/phosphatase (EEP) superfamily protein YafD